MSKKTDVLVIGSGMAGLMAALAAAKKNARVQVVSEGMGCLSISGGSIDLLGYVDDKKVDNPFEAITGLPANHPYSLAGESTIKEALQELSTTLAANGLEMKYLTDENGKPVNVLAPTVVGTLKPTFMFPSLQDITGLEKARSILVIGVHGFRDCKPQLVIKQLKRYKSLADKEYMSFVLPAPFKVPPRSISALDLAHEVERTHGRKWFLDSIKSISKKCDLALLPPILGAKASSEIRSIVTEALGCPYVEMQTMPPGVQGLRVRDALMNELYKLKVSFIENALVTRAEIKDDRCVGIISLSTGREIMHKPHAVVVATGGILSGGVILSQGSAKEKIFGLNIPVPENVDEWSEADVFGKHLVSSLGVSVDEQLRPLDNNGSVCLKNVFFAGRTLGGYDYAKEKSGHGVASVTGWKAGGHAADLALNMAAEQKSTGAAL